MGLDPQNVDLIIGVILPLLVAVVVKAPWSPEVKSLLALGACVVTGLLASILRDDFDADNIVNSVVTILVTAIALYKGLWKPTGVVDWVETKVLP